MTVTIAFAEAFKPLASVTSRAIILSPNVAVQSAEIVAEIVPFVFARFVTVNPAGREVAAIVKLPAAVSRSAMIANVPDVARLPCILVRAAEGAIVGGVFAQVFSKIDMLLEPEFTTAKSVR